MKYNSARAVRIKNAESERKRMYVSFRFFALKIDCIFSKKKKKTVFLLTIDPICDIIIINTRYYY